MRVPRESSSGLLHHGTVANRRSGYAAVGLVLAVSSACAEIVGADFDKAHPATVGAHTGGRGSEGGSAPAAGGRGSSADASDGDGASGGGTSNGGGATSGGGGSGGTGGGPNAGGTTSNGGGSGDACVPATWCRDGDGDGHGNPGESQLRCDSPGADWQTQCDDCDDGNPAVHPGADCSGNFYTVSGGTSKSFDFDCDGMETECGVIAKGSATCTSAGLGKCAGAGYLVNPQRTATAGQDAYCGSTVLQTCTSVAVPCVATKTTATAVLCR